VAGGRVAGSPGVDDVGVPGVGEANQRRIDEFDVEQHQPLFRGLVRERAKEAIDGGGIGDFGRDLADRYVDTGVDLPDLTVMAMASIRDAWILTLDYREFRSVMLDKGRHWDLLVQESELPRR
jgi:hypothetical protein